MTFTNDLLYLLLLYAVLDDNNTLTTTTGILIAAGIMLFTAFCGDICCGRGSGGRDRDADLLGAPGRRGFAPFDGRGGPGDLEREIRRLERENYELHRHCRQPGPFPPPFAAVNYI